MSEIFKFIFNLLISPLGLDIGVLEEYIILLIIGEAAFRVAFNKVGNLIGCGILEGRTECSLAHWIIRFAVFILCWAFARAVIWIYRFIAVYWLQMLIIFASLIAIALIVILSLIIYRKKVS